MIRFRLGLLSLIVGVVALTSLPAGKLWAPCTSVECIKQNPHVSSNIQESSLQTCYDHLTSGNFHIQGMEGDASVRITNALANLVMDLMHNEGDLTSFDQLVKVITKNQKDGHWILDEASDKILNDCYDAVHPEKE